jgi:hypothetical protein
MVLATVARAASGHVERPTQARELQPDKGGEKVNGSHVSIGSPGIENRSHERRGFP